MAAIGAHRYRVTLSSDLRTFHTFAGLFRVADRAWARGIQADPTPPRDAPRLEQSLGVRVRIDGEPATSAHGFDVDEQGNGTVTEQRLYQLIRQQQPISDRQFEIEFLDPGVEAFAFTFG